MQFHLSTQLIEEERWDLNVFSWSLQLVNMCVLAFIEPMKSFSEKRSVFWSEIKKMKAVLFLFSLMLAAHRRLDSPETKMSVMSRLHRTKLCFGVQQTTKGWCTRRPVSFQHLMIEEATLYDWTNWLLITEN